MTALRADFSVWWSVPTRWDDEDAYGHVNNVAYYAFVDTAVNGWLLSATGEEIRDLPAIGVVVETGCRFVRPLRFPDPVDVGIGLERLGRTSVAYRLGLFGPGRDDAAAEARFVHVYVDRDRRDPVPVPEVVRTAVGTLTTD